MIKKLTELGHKSKKTLIKMFKKENINWKFKKHQLIIDNIRDFCLLNIFWWQNVF